MKYAAYNDYNPGLTDWLPLVPSHWHSNRLRHLLSERLQYGANESAELDDPDLPRYVRITDIDENDSLRDETFRSLPEETAKPYILQDGDVLFARSGATSGKTFLYRNAWGRCAYAGYLIRARLDHKKLLPSFLRYFTASSNYWQWLSSSYIQATIQNVSAEKYADLWLPVPPLDEQQTIARFLDTKTSQIDELIAKKRQLIDKLKEKRQALIARTVTRGLPPEAARAAGLDPAPAMKDSGVGWLGQIPSHWECKPIKHLSRIGNGSTPARDNSDYWEDGSFPWLNSSMVNEDSVSNAEEFVTASALRECHLPVIKPPAILIGITGQGRTRGMATILLIEATINQHVAYVKPKSHLVDVHFLRRVFDNAYFYLRSESDGGGSTKGAITCDQIANLNVPLPPRAEQHAIAVYLDRETTQLDALASKVESATTRLTEYRQALITSAVTGKIDVRGVV